MNVSREPRRPAAHRGTCLLAVILSLAIGCHWAALQATAWTMMLIRFARDTTVVQAFSNTFDGQHPCSLCKLVQKGKSQQQQQRQASGSAGDDIKLSLPPCHATEVGKPARVSVTGFAFLMVERNYPPLHPPPRG